MDEIEQLIEKRKKYAQDLKKDYEEYILTQKDFIKEIPRLAYIANGKSGWAGFVDRWIGNSIVGLGMSKIVVSIKDFKLYRYISELKQPTERDIFNINVEDLNFQKLYGKVVREARDKKNDEVTQVLSLKEWAGKAIKLGFDLKFEDALWHYNSINDKYVYSVCKNEEEFEEMKNEIIKRVAKSRLSNSPSNF